MKCEDLLSLRKNKIKIEYHLLQILLGVLRVNLVVILHVVFSASFSDK